MNKKIIAIQVISWDPEKEKDLLEKEKKNPNLTVFIAEESQCTTIFGKIRRLLSPSGWGGKRVNAGRKKKD